MTFHTVSYAGMTRKWAGVGVVLVLLLSPTVWADGTLYKVRTNRLDCDYCAYDLQQTFEKMKGVKSFEVDLEGVFLITTRSGVRLRASQIKKILLDHGFDYNGMTEKKL